MKEKEKCQFCGGILDHKKTNVDLRVNNEFIIFEDVPAKVCGQCGEKYFSAEVYTIIEERVKKKEDVKKVINVPVMCFPVSV
ncbi:MAG: YgiT-type zinc finger domain-containing protein [Candidatus Altiarchaeales archaeon HGW-Altiarchaeales-1]|nr:MAG: YgiT-type zinc finger domain-containing protein [Candidatus Altiarchaeales archaeon HGW-Altiarchaeales-2]PKP61434.1 MAG: YgiT-type zinc finger domain-containing protein [Candidatus Altiarchaeales archaeon HGW-Altiarchaeales-1]